MIRKQLTLYLENKPRQLAHVTRRLAAAHINIEGISVSESTDVGLVQLVVDKAKSAECILRQCGVPYTSQSVCVVRLADRPGALSQGVCNLAKAGVNINYIYGTGSGGKGNPSSVVISAPNLQAVERAWNGA